MASYYNSFKPRFPVLHAVNQFSLAVLFCPTHDIWREIAADQYEHFFGLLNSDDDSVFCWELLAYFFPLLDDFIFIFFYYLSKFSKLFPLDQSISIQGCYTIVTC
jgi:hypothetical protein